jgi:formamidopyrimidine-DNA glycosylase
MAAVCDPDPAMPELPEVETVVRDLRPELTGRSLLTAVLTLDRLVRFPDPRTFVEGLRGARIEDVRRRGKYLLLPLARPEGDADELVVHLGMTGHLEVREVDAPVRPHTHLRASLDDGRELRYADARQFGRLLLGPRAVLEDAHAMPRLGVEPLSAEFTAAALDTVLRTTKRSVKAALLDQRGVAGLGNIYVDEACFRAGVKPQRRCPRLSRRERAALHEAIVAVLDSAVRNRGSSVDDYRDAWDAKGSNQEVLLAYGRAGLPCLRCGYPALRRAVVAGRGTSWCPGCQR